MLKLQSKDGKFDIVITDASLQGVGNVSKANVRSLSSAGRRKTREVKGNRVLPNHKDVSPRPIKHKGSQLRDTVKSKDGQLRDKVADSVIETPGDFTERNAQKTSLKQSDRPKAAVRPKGAGGAAQSRLKKDKTGTRVNKNIDTKNAGVISQSELALLMESLKKGDTSVLNAIAAKAAQGKNGAATENGQIKKFVGTQPSSEGIKQLQVGTRDTDLRTEPTVVPGLDFGNAEQESIYSHVGTEPQLDYKDSISTISMIESQRLGLVSQTSTHLQRNPPSVYESRGGKAERVAMRSSFAVGAPGQVAYDYNQSERDKNKQWLADLQSQIQANKQQPISDKERLAIAMQNPTPMPLSTRNVKVHTESTAINEGQKPLYRDTKVGYSKSQRPESEINHEEAERSQEQAEFARGKRSNKNQYEIDDIERQRQKHLEHQRAVEHQVEEKRRQKMMERERKAREEREEEEKLAKEREQLMKQYDEELKRQMEKEDAERQRHETLQQGILEAYESAKKEKQDHMLRKLRAGGHDISNLQHDAFDETSSLTQERPTPIESNHTRLTLPTESSEMPHQISSRSDKGFRPILNLTDDSYDLKEKETKKSKKQRTQKDVKGKNPLHARKDGGSEGDTSAKLDNKNNRNLKKVDNSRTSVDPKQSSRKEKIAKKTTGLQMRNQKTTKQDLKEHAPKRGNGVPENTSKIKRESNSIGKKLTEDKRVAKKALLKSNEVDNVETSRSPAPTIKYSNEEFEELDDYSYNRSSTVTLEESTSRKNSGETTNKASQHKAKDEQSTWDPWSVPTGRQQQILDQLQALRKGLMDKQKEHERVTTPSTGSYH